MPKRVSKCRFCGTPRQRGDQPCCEKQTRAAAYRRNWMAGKNLRDGLEKTVRRTHVRVYQTHQDQVRRFRQGELLPILAAFLPTRTLMLVTTRRHDLVVAANLDSSGLPLFLPPFPPKGAPLMACHLIVRTLRELGDAKGPVAIITSAMPWVVEMTDYEREGHRLRIGIDVHYLFSDDEDASLPTRSLWTKGPGLRLVVLANEGAKELILDPVRVYLSNGLETFDPEQIAGGSSSVFVGFVRQAPPDVQKQQRRTWIRDLARESVRPKILRKNGGESE